MIVFERNYTNLGRHSEKSVDNKPVRDHSTRQDFLLKKTSFEIMETYFSGTFWEYSVQLLLYMTWCMV